MTEAEKKSTILDNGDGLFQTHVQLDDVQDVIGEQMNTEARLGKNTKYTVVGDGNVLRSLATLQAGSLHLTEDEINSISGFDFKQMMGAMMNEEGMKNIYEQTREINPERLTEKTNTVEAFGLEVVNFELSCNLNKYVGIERDVLVHGDLWAANILWKEENDGKFSVSKVIDYQLKESYRCYFVSGGLVMMPMYGPIAQVKLSYSNDTESVEEYREILTEKAEHLMEDLERWHLYSKDKTNNFKEVETSN